MRRSLITSDPTVLGAHDHVAWCGDGPAAFERVAVAAFTAAVARGERLLFVAADPDPARLARLEGWRDLVDDGTLLPTPASEAYAASGDLAAQRAQFEGLLDQALADGYSGLCVAADNSTPAAAPQADFASWLAWEAVADRLQACRPINGICFFDTTQVPASRLSDVATLHPVLCADIEEPSFRLFFDNGVLRLTGELDSFSAPQIQRILRCAPLLTQPPLDISALEFIDHQALLVLDAAARSHRDEGRWRLCGAPPVVRRVWELLDVADPGLEVCP